MTKRHAEHLLEIALALLEDAKAMFPADQGEFERDSSRLSSLIEYRGLAVFTLDFPSVLKHLDWCLGTGTYTPSGLPHTRRFKKGSVLPRLFRGVHLRIFDHSGVLKVEPDVNAIALLRQLYAIGKKYRIECKKGTVDETVRSFHLVDESLPYPSLDWTRETLDGDRNRLGVSLGDIRHYSDGRLPPPSEGVGSLPSIIDRFHKVCGVVSTSLGSFDPEEWRFRHGPGAVADLSKGDDKYHFPQWSARLDTVFPYSRFAFANYTAWVDALEQPLVWDDRVPSRMIAVPKTQKGPRLIACEPVAHQWCQQSLWDYFRTKCDRSWLSSFIAFGDQTVNQDAARMSSVNDDHWTVDLSAASDRVSLWIVERCFRDNISLLNALHASRTRFVQQDITPDVPRLIELKKFSTMGSACTFPVETLIFLMIAMTAVIHVDNVHRINVETIKRHCKGIHVFGDDIVIPKRAGDVFEALLGYLDFQVNHTKTFRNGRFRESCGMEAFDGYDVTPAYVLRVSDPRKPETLASAVATSNNFHLKGWWRAADKLKSTVKIRKMPILSIGSGHFGWTSFVGSDLSRIKSRINRYLHREEYLCAVVSTRARKRPTEGYAPLLQFFTEDPDPELPWVSGAVGRPKLTIRFGWVASEELDPKV